LEQGISPSMILQKTSFIFVSPFKEKGQFL